MTTPALSARRPRSAHRAAALLVLAAAVGAGCGGGDEAAPGAGEAAPAEEAASTAERRTDVGATAADDALRGAPVGASITLPALTLTDTRGRPFRLREETRRRLTLLFLGYTHCPDVCPVQLANLGAVLDDLTPSLRRQVRVVFVTVDPARDSAARLRSWLDRFGEGFVGLRGTDSQVRALQDSLRLPRATRQDRRVRGRYTMGHAAQVLAFGADGRALRAYPSGTRQGDWRHDLPRLVRAATGGRAIRDGGGDAASGRPAAPGGEPPTGEG